MSDWKSITVRPREKNFGGEEWVKKLEEHFTKKKMSYIIGREKGENGSKFNHLQITVNYGGKNGRRMIDGILKFKPEDEFEAKCWLKVVTTNDEKYNIGYCAKESDYVCNINGDVLEEAIKYYKTKKETISQSKKLSEWVCTGLNSVFQFAYEFAVERGVSRKPFGHIILMMVGERLIPLTLYQKACKKELVPAWIAYKSYIEDGEVNMNDATYELSLLKEGSHILN